MQRFYALAYDDVYEGEAMQVGPTEELQTAAGIWLRVNELAATDWELHSVQVLGLNFTGTGNRGIVVMSRQSDAEGHWADGREYPTAP